MTTPVQSTKTAQTTLWVGAKLLATLVLWLALLHYTDLSTIPALVTASAVATGLTLYLSRTIPLVMAGKKSLGSVAQDMMKMADRLDEISSGEFENFSTSAQELSSSLEDVTDRTGITRSPRNSDEESASPTTPSTMDTDISPRSPDFDPVTPLSSDATPKTYGTTPPRWSSTNPNSPTTDPTARSTARGSKDTSPTQQTLDLLNEAAGMVEMKFPLETVSRKTGIPTPVLERLERSGNGYWTQAKRNAHDHLLRRMGDTLR